MTDIYDIKANMLWLPFDIIFSLLFIIFFIIFYIILNKYFNKEEKENVDILQCNMSTEKENKDYLEILKNIEENYVWSQSEIFYAKLDEVLRDFLEEKQEIPISKMTFEEIKSLNLEIGLEKLIKKIYFREFDKNISDNIDSRKEVLEEVRTLVK